MTCLQAILHALSAHQRPVMLRISTLRARAGSELAELRSDLPLRKQVEHWASLQGLVATWSNDDHFVTFHPTTPEHRPHA